MGKKRFKFSPSSNFNQKMSVDWKNMMTRYIKLGIITYVRLKGALGFVQPGVLNISDSDWSLE